MGAGQRFYATLESSLVDGGGQVVVVKGTKVLGVIAQSKSAGRIAGRSEVELAFTDLEINGLLFPIQSQGVQAVGEGSGKDTARKVAAGALVGAAIDGGKGAATGAAVGGAAALLTRGKEIRIPAGTILELTLMSAVNVPAPAAAAAAPSVEAAPTAAAAAPTAAAAAPAAPAAAAPAAATAPAAEQKQKECIKKLMANGFSADEAVASCEKQ